MTKGYSPMKEEAKKKKKHRLQETDPRERKRQRGKPRSPVAAVGPESNSVGWWASVRK